MAITRILVWLLLLVPSRAAGFDEWHIRRRIANETFGLANIVYGNGLYVGVSSTYLMVSSDGTTWQQAPVPVTFDSKLMAFGNGYFTMATNFSNYVSADAINWELHYTGILQPVSTTFGNGIFVSESPNIGMAISNDAMNWTITRPANSDRFSVLQAAGDYLFAMEGGGGTPTYTSTTGDSWLRRTLGTKDIDYLNGVAYGNGVYVMVGNDGLILRSPNASTWTIAQRFGGGSAVVLKSVAFGNGRFVACADYFQTPTLFDSTDGIAWRAWNADAQALYKVAFVNDRFMAVGQNTILSSFDGQRWESVFSPTTSAFRSVAYGTNKFLALGEGHELYQSTNGVSWEPGSVSASYDAVAYDGARWVGVGAEIGTSTAGTFFTRRLATPPGRLHGVSATTSLRVAVGDNGAVCVSSNGTTWVARDSGLTTTLNSVAYGNGRYVAVGQGGAVYWSSTADVWTPANSTVAVDLHTVAYCEGRFLAVGDSGTLIQSTDGGSWIALQTGTNERLNAVVSISPRDFMICGANGTVLVSNDGITWRSANAGITDSLNAACVGGTSIIAVGARGTVVQTGSFGPRLARFRSLGNSIVAEAYGDVGVACNIEASDTMEPGSWWTFNTVTLLEGATPVTMPVDTDARRFYRIVTQ